MIYIFYLSLEEQLYLGSQSTMFLGCVYQQITSHTPYDLSSQIIYRMAIFIKMVCHLSIFSFQSNVSKVLRQSVRKRLTCFSNVEYATTFATNGIHYISAVASKHSGNFESIFGSFHRLLIIQKRTNYTFWF